MRRRLGAGLQRHPPGWPPEAGACVLHGGRCARVQEHLHRRSGVADAPCHDLQRAGPRHLARVAHAGEQAHIAGAHDLHVRPGLADAAEPHARHRVVHANEREARPAVVLLDLRGGPRGAVDHPAVVEQLVVVRVSGIDESYPGIGEQARQLLATVRHVARKGVHEHQRRLPFGLRPREFAGGAMQVVRAEPEIGAALARAHHIQKDAAMSAEDFALRALRRREGSLVGGQAAALEVVITRDRPPGQRQRAQRLHDRRVLCCGGVVGVVARQVDEGGIGGMCVGLLHDLPQPRQRGPVVGLVHVQVADVEPVDGGSHAPALPRSAPRAASQPAPAPAPAPAQAGISSAPKPTHSATETSAKPPST